MSHKNNMIDLLARIGVEVYTTPVDKDDVVVCLGRLLPMTDDDKSLVMAERRALQFIEAALKLTKDAPEWDIRFSRPWVLKKDTLVYTWDFTLKGDVALAIEALRKIPVLKVPVTREEDVAVQRIKPKRGRIRPVSIGAIR
jgi:hypothetical protein